MAVYKVPQDVEADDKLIGPFSFRQFIYLIIVCLAILLAWGLAQLFIPLAIIPLPIVVFFGALALPLRKDQPMEIYMAAMVSFYLKPHKRLWDPDGLESLIEITVPKTVEPQLTKDLSQTEAEQRLNYLAQIVDTRGWAVRGPGVQAPDSAVNTDVFFEAQQIEDVMDDNTSTMQALDDKLEQSDAKRHQEMMDMMVKKAAPPKFVEQPAESAEPETPKKPKAKLVEEKDVKFNPYPEIHQTVIEPLDPTKQVPVTPVSTSVNAVSPDIINLANNTDLSVAAIAREANRIAEKQDLEDGTVISLR